MTLHNAVITLVLASGAWLGGPAAAQTGGNSGGGPLARLIATVDINVVNGLSPYNWVRGAGYINSAGSGSSLTLGFRGTRKVALRVDTSNLTTLVASRYPIIAWSVNGGALQTHQLVARETAVVLAAGMPNPMIDLYLKGVSPFEDHYNGDVPASALKITGFEVDARGRTVAAALPSPVWLNIGDSIMAGDAATYATGQGRPADDAWAAADDARASYGSLLAQHYGYREARLAYGGYNWGGGMAGVPALTTLIDQITSTVSRLSGGVLSPAPAVALLNLGENGAPAAPDVTNALTKLRRRTGPQTKIIVMIPVSGRARAEVTTAFHNYQATSGDANIYLVDLGQLAVATADGQHPNAAGHRAIYNAALPTIERILKATTISPSAATLRWWGRWDRRAAARAVTVNSGSYLLSHFSGTGVAALFDVALNQAPLPTIAWRIDEGEWQEAEVAPEVQLADNLLAGPHRLMLMARGLDEHQNRWTKPLVASITCLGLRLAAGSQALPPLPGWDHPTLTIEFLGDSITEGVLVQNERPGKTTWPWRTDATHSYAAQTALRLGAAWRQVGFGATGLAHGGSGGAPGALDSFNAFYDGCPRDDWQPDLVVINQGTNDSALPPADYRPLYARYLALLRSAYPQARIVALRPFNGAQAISIQAEVAARQAAGDHRVYYIDTTGWNPGDLHPNAASSAIIADHLAIALRAQVLSK